MSCLPWAWTANIVHDFAGWPSTRIVQAPQWVVSQPMWVPVSRSTSRIICTSSKRGSTFASCFSPLTESFTSIVLSPAPGTLDRLAERPGRQHAHEILLVLDGTAQVGRGFRGLGGELGSPLDRGLVRRLPFQSRLGLRGLDGREAHVGQSDTDVLARAVRPDGHLCVDRLGGEVADLALELQIGAPATRRRARDPDLHENLVGPEAGRERPREERRDRHAPLALGPDGD